MLVNLCCHIFLTCAVFVGGITQTRNASVCQAVSAREKLRQTKVYCYWKVRSYVSLAIKGSIPFQVVSKELIEVELKSVT